MILLTIAVYADEIKCFLQYQVDYSKQNRHIDFKVGLKINSCKMMSPLIDIKVYL